MPSVKDYFDKVTYKPKYHLGDRVRGIWNGIPFSGTVDVETLIDEYEGPYIMVNLDLPIKFDNSYRNIIKTKHDDLIDLKGLYDINSKTNSKKSVVGSNRRKR